MKEDEEFDGKENLENGNATEPEAGDVTAGDAVNGKKREVYGLSGMFQNWFLDYASYVILERAVPHLEDGLKPVQRRILHSMKELDDGRYNKVANIVGNTMSYHPHGDSSIGGALVQLGQKGLLIDCQGNWGNILTGDGAAAPRYIEGRLSKFALDVVYSPKVTDWKLSYDGRKNEPITLPVKFPLLLAHGDEGIGVGLASKILPHNFNEINDAAIAYLKGEDFVLYPDFQTGGLIDVTRYNDGERGGRVRVRTKISKIDNKTLAITDLPFGKTTTALIASIIKAYEKGKINIKKVEDNTSENAEIIVHLEAKTSSDKTIDALYAFTDCEVSISPNCCVISDKKPIFTNVSNLLKMSVDRTKDLLRRELEIQKADLEQRLLFCSLEKIFIEERIYKDKKYEEGKTIEAVVEHIYSRLEPFKKMFVRDITREDIDKLFEIRMKRILKFNSEKAEELIVSLNEQIAEVVYNLEHLTEYAIKWFETLKAKYGDQYPRKTEVRSFENIQAAKVVEANEKLYVNREEGFIGTSLKKDEFVCNCSDIDDIILIYKDGKYKIVKVAEKLYVGKNLLYVNVFKKNDKRTIYNVIYRDGKGGVSYMKRFAVTGVSRDKEYDITQGTPGSRILYFTANPNAEAEIVKVTLKPKLRLKVTMLERNFSEIAIKGRQSMGNILTKNEILKITLKQRGLSTMGGRKVWFDKDILRLNYDEKGVFLGEFQPEDKLLVVNKKGEYYTTTFDESNHFEESVLIVEKFDQNKVWSVALYDADAEYKYLKRFVMEPSVKPVRFLGENPKSELILISDTYYPRFEVSFGGNDAHREPIVIDVEEFIGVKGIKAKGKRIHTWDIAAIKEIEPLRFPQEEELKAEEPEEEADDDNDGQISLF
ncbi:MAG: DNA gyrase/topoisomerase IV subunit A [Paludibacteraceae bacterium]|jgi:topoisomerase-4 subunit A|nr:DNA gyrase/topoisomerase IV subunit A [Paludibacteraceae bacterium]